MIGIITLNHDTFTNPTLYAIIRKLNEDQVPVVIFSAYQQSHIPEELTLTCYANAPSGLKLPRNPLNIFRQFRAYLSIIDSIKKNRIKHIIGVDPAGLIIAGRIKKWLPKLQLHYCSFEIFFSNEIPAENPMAAVKAKEISYTQNVASIVIQDVVRQRLLTEENRIGQNIMWHLIPTAPIIQQNFNNPTFSKSNYGFKDSDTVYVHSGSVATWSGIEAIIEAIENGLPPNTYILIHNRSKFNPEDPFQKRLLQLKNENYPVVLHDEHFESYTAYCAFLQAFDFGIALYKTDGNIYTGRNLQEIGLASGKFCTYMALGIPTLLFDCTTFNTILEQYPVGASVNEQQNLSEHITHKTLQKVKREACFNLYNELLDPQKAIHKFVASIS